jgi:exodeoxyribonuclease VII large subunit
VHNLAAILERTVHRWLEDQQRELDQFGNEIQWSSQAIVRSHSNAMRTMEMQLNWHADRWLQSKNHVVESLAHQFDRQSRQVILQRRSELNNWMKTPFRSAQQQLLLQSERLQSMERSMASLHPEQTVKRGFAILSHQGQIIPDLIGLGPGDELEIQTRTGVARVTVQSIAPNDSKQKPEN